MAGTNRTLALLAAALLAVAAGPVGLADQQSDQMAEIVPRADDISMNLTIENIDGKVVNVPETQIRAIPPGDHYLGVKIELRAVSGGSLLSGLGVFSAVSGAVDDKPPVHDGISFTAEPGKRYLLTGAMVDGKPKIWVEEETYASDRDDDLR
jgi:hypothetical protein